MNPYIISIIIPVHNSEKFLTECIESIIAQNKSIYEILLIENGSTDNSKDICKFYAEKYDFIRTYSIPGRGVSNARNYGIERATGEWITFIDSDDFISSEYMNSIESYLNSNTDLIAFNYIRYINKFKKESGILTIKEGEHNTPIDLFKLAIRLEIAALTVWSSIYKNDIIKNHHIRFREDMKTSEDFTFNLSYYKFIQNFTIVNKPLYYYRQNPNSVTSIRDLRHAVDYQIVYDILKEIIKTYNIDKTNINLFKERWTKWILALVYNYKIQNFTNKTINETVYSKSYYIDLTNFKLNNTKSKIERFLLKYKMNSTIVIYCRIIDFIKKVLNRYKI